MDTMDDYRSRLVEIINRQESEITRLSSRITECEKEKAKAFWEGWEAERIATESNISELQRAVELWRESHLSDEKYWRRQLTRMQKALDEMTLKSNAAHRDAAYWHEEFTKLQKESLAPISEVAKIYVRVSPDMLARIMREE